MTLDWKSIRPFNGGREKGFEELCAQLARAEISTGVRFERKGTPDAGVECYAVLNDDSEWGWQAKYFDVLGDSQWSQLNESVKTAIEKHPKLTQYFICIPLDRPDARIVGKKSAKDKWDEYVKRWKQLAVKKGMNIEFIYWGSHELIERLTRPEHIGRLRFWFDMRGFDNTWFSARLDESLRTAGPRYTPEIHIDLPIAQDFEIFGRTDKSFEYEKAHARSIREKLNFLKHTEGTPDVIVDAKMASVLAKIQDVLTSMGTITGLPTGPLPFKSIVEQISAAELIAEDLLQILIERERAHEAKPDSPETTHSRSYQINPFRDRRIQLLHLTSELQITRESLIHANDVADRTLMILRGAAGTGKTHLLCDVAKQRIAAGLPTILLMGQRFVSNDAPWAQTIQQLDLGGMAAEEFVGALEAAAQAANSRALLMIDAINEGTGRAIWPSHLEAFLAHLERSPWIGVVLAVRSSYEEIIIPAEVRARATIVTHQGFIEHEYDATRTFFIHYGLELPSTPLLAPEFQNPLFLKTLCQGLNADNEHRLPRGFHGITTVFNLYLRSANKCLASRLDFNAQQHLIDQALKAVVNAFLEQGKAWLPAIKVAEIVNAFLPGRDFERSLYRGLIVEGILIEEATRYDDKPSETVYLAYERLADHLTAKTLLSSDDCDLSAAFAKGGSLAFICNQETYVSPGLLEALCIQIPEQTGKELIFFAPTCAERQEMGDAFRQSIVWRSYKAFSDNTRDTLNKLCRSEHDSNDTIDVLLTVATLPGHPYNAEFLDRRLREDTMPVRDAWWSVYLHQAWGTHNAVDRVVDWASTVDPSRVIDSDAVDLCAIALSWMQTSSNRFLRDRATKALVCLLTGRLEATIRLVERFANTDDPYVTERIYAVAYAVAMRSHDAVMVGTLAQRVYNLVFTTGSPPPHILLRDYARGVIERALHLGSVIDASCEHFRPPYKSVWPMIPTDEEIKPLLADWSEGSHDSGKLKWSRNRIGSSVMSDDFARYVIGTNSSLTSSVWLSLTLDDPIWKPPPRLEDRLNSLVSEFSNDETKAWKQFETVDKEHAATSSSFIINYIIPRFEKNATSESVGNSELLEALTAIPPEDSRLAEKRKEAINSLKGVLTEEHKQLLEEIWAAKETDYETRQPPRFELHQIQKYILKRVFDLGWTEERFGSFDRFYIANRGREASKAERIGKKYQWIAYHEIMAFVSDHFQYREQFCENDADQAYEGPWQNSLRDIDPSCTMRSLCGGTGWIAHTAAWWGPATYDAWEDLSAPRDWVLRCDNLPKIEDLLIVTNPKDNSRWINGDGYFKWQSKLPIDREATDIERREIWYNCTAYLVRADDALTFLQWAESINFGEMSMPQVPQTYEMFLGEHAWAPASHYFQTQYHEDDGWTQPDHGCPIKIRNIAFNYFHESNGIDCSVDESLSLRLPESDLITGLGIRWSGHGADFLDSEGRVAAQDPTAYANGPSALLLREDVLRKFLESNRLTICWAIFGEKNVHSPGIMASPYHPSLRISGAYALSDGHLTGFVKRTLDDPNKSQQEGNDAIPEVIDITRC